MSAPLTGELIEVEVGRPAEARLGERTTYTIALRNVSDSSIQNVRLEQRGLEHFEIMETRVSRRSETDDEQGGDRAENGESRSSGRENAGARDEGSGKQPTNEGESGRAVWKLGPLAADDVVEIEVAAIPRREGRHDVKTLVRYDAPIETTWNVVEPELSARIVGGEEAHWICEEIEISYELTNDGTGTTDPIVVRGELPPGLQTEDGEARFEMELEPLGPGETTTEELELVARSRGEYEVRVQARAGELEVESPSAVVTVLEPAIELSVQSPERVQVGRRVEAQASVHNVGEDPAHDVDVEVAGTENVTDVALVDAEAEADDDLEIGSLEPGERRTFRVRFRAEEIGEASLRLTATGKCLEEESAERTADLSMQVVGVPAVRLELVDAEDPVEVGQTATYRVRVKNQGSAEDLGLELRLQLPETMVFESADGASEVQGREREVTLGPLRRIAPNEVAEWTVQASVVGAGEGTAVLQLRSAELSDRVTEEETTRTVQ